jgi:hypothetical protein
MSIHPKREAGFDVKHFATGFDGVQFGLGFDIEEENVAVQSVVNFSVLLTYTGEDYLLRVDSHLAHSKQFSAGNNVIAGAEVAEKL